MTVHCSRKMFVHIMNEKNEDIRIFFSQKGAKRAAHRMICIIVPHSKKGKPIFILYSNKNMK